MCRQTGRAHGRRAGEAIQHRVKKMMIDAIEVSMDRLESYEVDLRTSKIVMEELCDWHACNVIDEAIRTTGKAVKLIAGKMEEINR